MILIVGAGPMSVEYAKVLTALGYPWCCVTRGEAGAQAFFDQTGVLPTIGGLSAYLKNTQTVPHTAIVATGMESLYPSVMSLLDAGVKAILVEKPAAMRLSELTQMSTSMERQNARIFVAYNRRFYASTQYVRSCCQQDGGVTSLLFEVTEWGHVIGKLDKLPAIKQKCFVGNTSHVVDLAFHLGGQPETLQSTVSGSLPWHTAAARFAGSGRTRQGALFSYFGDWEAPGRWGVEVLTRKRRFVLKPLEGVLEQPLGSVKSTAIVCPEQHLDEQFKPGIYKQTEAFLSTEQGNLCDLNQHLNSVRWYYQMAGYAAD
ncbi:Gfo/Idh/MocA family oxidoreductase [Aestuariibacter halophilus]|uniref:Gfo/Idh/MocA family oxidoreductase n=1 Tax=Fluctibacter halophilus TaxID=226011 RepID=A0ABS8G3H2_9ALTE|nr:Gfo/Idh/MocA family oxidoreductase [Aestuariibacter halophilus]MCC2615134.1 Gfo/Idh/MocA family oxidoreductase [Aestuariibacter halophilus]